MYKFVSANKESLKIVFILLAVSVNSDQIQMSTESTEIFLNAAHVRHAHLRCLQKYPQAEIINYSNTEQTHCYLHCLFYRSGLMDLNTRGLDIFKFFSMWDEFADTNVTIEDCVQRFDFIEPLDGTCIDTYRKLLELRYNCLDIFDYFFTTKNTTKSNDFKQSKQIGQSATEFCELIEQKEDKDVSIITQYAKKLKCIFENIHYLDAYGRIDETEINLSYQDAGKDSSESQAIVHSCCHRANSKFRPEFLQNMILELQKCLKDRSEVFVEVFILRDEISRQY